MYCSETKHTQQIERIQRQATKYILNDYMYTSDYKSCLLKLHILPQLLYVRIFWILMILCFHRSLQTEHDGFDKKFSHL